MANVPDPDGDYSSFCQTCAAGLDCDVHGGRAARAAAAVQLQAQRVRAAFSELANAGPREIAVITYLTRREATVLAQFVKRITWNEIAANAVDHDEAELMRDAIERLRRGLADSGYDPR